MSVRKSVAAAAVAAVIMLGGAPIASAQGEGSGKLVNLTAAQETCLAAARSAAKGQTGAARKANIKSAAQACGVWKRFHKLTAEEQACLASHGLKRPTGAPTRAHKKALRTLAASCGVTLKVKG
ncbi:MAG: hypothetical protein ACO36A_05920 [Ilumatobacteraceae bacterium]